MPTAGTLTMTSPRKRLVQCSRWFLHHQQDLRRFINWGNNCISSQQASPITKFSVKMTLTKSWLISFQLCTVHSLNQEAATSGSCCNFGPPVRRSAARPDPRAGTALPWSSECRAASLVAWGRVLEARASTRTTPADELIAGDGSVNVAPSQGPLRHPRLPVYFPPHLRRHSGTFGSSLENDSVFAPSLSAAQLPANTSEGFTSLPRNK